MASRVLPAVGFTLYPEEKKVQQPPSTFASEGKLSYPTVVKAESPFESSPMPAAPKPAPAPPAAVPPTPSVSDKRLAKLEADVLSLQEYVKALEARVAVVEVARAMDTVDSLDAELLDAFVNTDTETVATMAPPSAPLPSSEDDDQHEEEDEVEDGVEETKESEVRTIVLTKAGNVKRAREVDAEKAADIVSKLAGRSERDVNNTLKATEVSDMLAALGKQYVPPKIEGVRLLVKTVAELSQKA